MPVWLIAALAAAGAALLYVGLLKLERFGERVMASIQEITAKVDALQQQLDAEQEQVTAALRKLQDEILVLQALVAEGGTVEERQAIVDKLEGIAADLAGTIPDAPPDEV